MSKDYYAILEVAKNATPDEIKKAFRKKAHQFHPDKATSDAERATNEARFKEINQAYQVLSDSQKRQQYDQFGSGFENAGHGAGYGGFGGFGGQGGVNINMDDLEDMLGGVFGGGFGGRRRAAKRGADLEVKVEISLTEAVTGTDYKLNHKLQVACKKCSGSGAENGKQKTCTTCKGQGQVASVQKTFLGSFQSVRTCSDCDGKGQVPEHACKDCSGSGVVKEAVSFEVQIPPGVRDQETLRLSGKGEAGPKGAPAGDLYVTVRVKPDPRFERRDDDLWTELSVSFSEAALGTEKEIETVEGKVILTVPAGIQSGTVLKLSGKGVPHLQQRGRGDQFVEVKVVTPKHLSKGARQLFEQLRDLNM